MTELLFREDAYAQTCDAKVTAVNDRGGIMLDRTVFYATSGGQPGDRGVLLAEGHEISVATTVYGEDKSEIVHVPAETPDFLRPGMAAHAVLDWRVRHAHMRAHTAMHLLCSLVPFPVTGGQVATDGGRLDFDIPDPKAIDRERLESEINRLIGENHPVTAQWITDEELQAKPELVRTMSVKPPLGSGRVRLIVIGDNGSVDLQPCGGTHVRSTAEIGPITVGKPESKGKQNRRIRLNFV